MSDGGLWERTSQYLKPPLASGVVITAVILLTPPINQELSWLIDLVRMKSGTLSQLMVATFIGLTMYSIAMPTWLAIGSKAFVTGQSASGFAFCSILSVAALTLIPSAAFFVIEPIVLEAPEVTISMLQVGASAVLFGAFAFLAKRKPIHVFWLMALGILVASGVLIAGWL